MAEYEALMVWAFGGKPGYFRIRLCDSRHIVVKLRGILPVPLKIGKKIFCDCRGK